MRFRLDIPEPEILDSVLEIQDLVDDITKNKCEVAYDTETSGLDYYVACYLFALAYVSPTRGARRLVIPTYKPHQHQYFEILKPWLEDETLPVIAHNALYDWRVMRNHGITVRGLVCDTLKAHHVYAENELHGLKWLADKYLGIHLLDFKKIFGKEMTRTLVAEVFEDDTSRGKAVEYATLDAWATLELYHRLNSLLETKEWNAPKSLVRELNLTNKPTFVAIHRKLDVPFIEILQRMYARGVPFNKEKIEALKKHAQLIFQENCNYFSNPNDALTSAQHHANHEDTIVAIGSFFLISDFF
jgi:DNA polymerase-1